MIAYSALDTNLLNLLRSFVNDPAYPTTLRQAAVKQSIQALATGSIFDLAKIDIPELQETELWNVVPVTTIITATKGATTLTVPSTVGYPTSGSLYTQLGVITYTGITSTTFTGIPASGAGSIKANIQAGQTIYYLYPLPTDFASVSNVYLGQLGELMYMEYRKLLNGVSIGSIGNYNNY